MPRRSREYASTPYPKKNTSIPIIIAAALVVVLGIFVTVVLPKNRAENNEPKKSIEMTEPQNSQNDNDLDDSQAETVEDNVIDENDVQYIQEALSEMGYSNVVVNGIYDAATESAVIRFQQNHGYEQDGILNKEMIEKISNALNEWRSTPSNSEPESVEPDEYIETEEDSDVYPMPERKLYYKSSGPFMGEDVKYIQEALIKLDYSGVELNGIYDYDTEAAVKMFQSDHGLVVDGIVGPQTLAEFYYISNNYYQYFLEEDAQYPVPTRTLRYNASSPMSGEDVKFVQAALIDMDYLDTEIYVNGVYDSYTEATVKRFQTNHDLYVDGIVGPKTTAELKTALFTWKRYRP